MQELIKKLEKATGPDRELDRDIGVAALGWRPFTVNGHHKMLDVGDATYPDSPGSMYPALTESIDAALTLVPRGWRYLIHDGGTPNDDRAFANVFSPSGSEVTYNPNHAATTAIALCIAALKARQLTTE